MLSYKNKITIQDVADMAGVSKTTVSRYINGKYEYMSEETRQRIGQIIEKTGYMPSTSAQSLKSNRTGLIGLLIADIGNPFSTALLTSITDSLHQIGYNVLVANANNSQRLEAEYLHSFLSRGVDGIIINPVLWENPLLVSLKEQGLPIMLLDRQVKGCELDLVYLENERSICCAVEHLREQGYDDIWLLSWEYQNISVRYDRYQAFLKCMRTYGVPEPEKQVHIQTSASGTGLLEALDRIVTASRRRGKTPGVITANEILLLETIQAVKKLQLRMPRELGVCGFDDWGWSDMIWPTIFSPTITTLDAEIQRMGRLAAHLIVERIMEPHQAVRKIPVPVELVPRESTDLKAVRT